MGQMTNLRAIRASRGIALLMTLITLVVLTISTIAMMQLLKSGATTAGNIAFRQAAVRAGDLAVEDARNWLLSQPAATLLNDVPGRYYAKYNGTNMAGQTEFDPRTYDFTNSTYATKYTVTNGGTTTDSFSDYKIYYVIHRMAAVAGYACSDGTQPVQCVTPPAASSSTTNAGSSHGAGSGYQAQIQGTTGLVFYRITAKVVGPRFNNRYVQAFFY